MQYELGVNLTDTANNFWIKAIRNYGVMSSLWTRTSPLSASKFWSKNLSNSSKVIIDCPHPHTSFHFPFPLKKESLMLRWDLCHWHSDREYSLLFAKTPPIALLLFLERTWKKKEVKTELLSGSVTRLEKSFQIARGASIALFSWN